MKIPVVIQMQPGENGAAALCMMLGYHMKYVPMEELREKCVTSRNGSSPEQIIRAAQLYGIYFFDITVEFEYPNMLLLYWDRGCVRFGCVRRKMVPYP